MRRTLSCLLLNVSTESPSFRAKPGMSHPLFEASISPYKEQFKDFWSTPIPFADREYGKKPKLGEPIPTRNAATAVVVAKNKYIKPELIETGEDNDYKILMLYRESKQRLAKDQFVLPSLPVSIEDRSEDWQKILRRRGVTSQWQDLEHRLTAMRALFSFTNLLVIPKEGGGLAEVEGPPGPGKWHLIVHSRPKAMKNLIDILELPMETSLSQFLPFRKIVTPTSETFRFDNLVYLIPFEKIPDVRYTITTEGEKLAWVSPMEGMARFNAGIMDMPTPNIVIMSELANECPTFEEVLKRTNQGTPRSVLPEVYHHGQTRVATVLLPGDLFHAETTDEDRRAKYVRRFEYEKDYPYGVRAIFSERPASPEEITEPLVKETPVLLEEANENDMAYADVPYPVRRKERLRNGETRYPVPQYVLKDGKMDKDGFIPSNNDYMNLPTDDMYAKMK
ncbi:unnamed protein product [Phytomonas sp. Hart1]|nr:unnamed protein product [Phytomonas sp. Hart1]|eukprot:CCW66609.1 unnamed protein product [Phytomonas sp. isolate Hart1]